MTEFFRGVETERSVGERAPDHRLESDGTRLQIAYPVADDQTVRYAAASGDDFAIHLDDEFARKVGLPGRIVHGLCTMASPVAPSSKRRASTIRAPCDASPCASPRRSFPATR